MIDRDLEGRPVEEAFLGSPGGPAGAPAAPVLLARVRREWDERGRERRTTASRFGPGIPAAAPPAVETRWFDRSGRLVRRVDPAGGVWTIERDGAGRPAREVDPAGDSISREYDLNGRVRVETREDLSGASIDPQAGAAGDPDYAPDGRLRVRRRTVLVRDPLGRVTAAVEDSGRTRRLRHDARGLLVHATDAMGTEIHAALDPEIADLVPLMTVYQTDHANSAGNAVHLEYDALGRLTRAVRDLHRDGKGQLEIDHRNPFNDDGLIDERFEWDRDGRLTAFTDDRGSRTALTRDRLGRIRMRTDPDGGSERYEWDLAGGLTRVTGRSGIAVTQAFDALGRLARREIDPSADPQGALIEGTRLQLFEHDGLGRPTLAFDGNRTDTTDDDQLLLRSYDSLGGLASEAQGRFVISAARDARGEGDRAGPRGRPEDRGRARRDGPRHVHDGRRGDRGAPRLARSVDRALARAARGHPPELPRCGCRHGPPAARPGAGGEPEREEYLGATGATVLRYDSGHDREGRRLWERRLHRGGRGPSYQYDSIGRPAEFQADVFDPRNPPINPTSFTQLFPDGAHNPVFAIVDFVERRNEADSLDRLVKVGGSVLAYDGAGDLASAGALELRHDGLGRLVRVIRAGATVARYAYDAAGCWDPLEFRGRGRLARREVLLPGEGEKAGVTRRVSLGPRPVEERADGGALLRTLLRGPGGRPLAVIDAATGDAAAVLCRGDGTPAGITSAGGALQVEVLYDVLGMPAYENPAGVSTAAATAAAVGLLGMAAGWEPSSGLAIQGGRAYSPALGRWTSPGGPIADPMPLRLNPYALLDPVNGPSPLHPPSGPDPWAAPAAMPAAAVEPPPCGPEDPGRSGRGAAGLVPWGVEPVPWPAGARR